jgi:hypothetical protein
MTDSKSTSDVSHALTKELLRLRDYEQYDISVSKVARGALGLLPSAETSQSQKSRSQNQSQQSQQNRCLRSE